MGLPVPRSRTACVLASLLALVALVPAAQAASFGTFGSFIDGVDDTDFVPLLTEPTEELCLGYLKDTTTPTDIAKRAWFFHVSSDGDCNAELTTSGRSFRITAYGGATNLAWTTDAAYLNKAFDTNGDLQAIDSAAWLCTLEADGIPGISPGDGVYVDREEFDASGTTGSLTVSDLRFIAPSSTSGAPYSPTVGLVKTADADITLANKVTDDITVHPTSPTYDTCGTVGWDALALDMGALGDFDSSDLFYLLPPSPLAGGDYVYPGVGRITSGGGVTGGQVVAGGAADAIALLTELTSAMVNVETTGVGTTLNQFTYLHVTDPSGDNTRIFRNDLVIERSTAAAAGSPGVLVSTSTGHGDLITGSTAIPSDLLYYMDADDDSVFDLTEGVYMKHPTNMPSGTACGTLAADEVCIQVNDIRIKAAGGKTAGSTVASGDSDFTANDSEHKGRTGFVLKWQSANQDARPSLSTITGKFLDNDLTTTPAPDNLWQPATESVYIGSSTTVVNGMLRVWNSGSEDNTNVVCPGDSECGLTLDSGLIKSTGPSTSWDALRNEQLVWSADALLTEGDYRLQTLGALAAGEILAADDALVAQPFSSANTLFASLDACAPCLPFPQVGDVKISPSFGTQLDQTSGDVVPRVQTVAPRLIRANLGSQSSLVEDVYYFDFGTGFLPGEVMRASDYGAKQAGDFLTSADTVETQATKVIDTDATDDLGFVEDGTTNGFNADDRVYIDLPALSGGGTEGSVSTWDGRITNADGCSACTEGSRVQNGQVDLTGTIAFTDEDFLILWWDADGDGEPTKADFFWLHHGTVAPDTPAFLDVRLGGDAGITAATGGGGGGGGGGGNTGGQTTGGTTTPGTTTTGTTTTGTTTTGTTTTDTTTSDTTTSDDDAQDEAELNQEIEDGLDVDREDGQNIVTWPDVDADGYLIFSSDSPYALEDEVPGSQTSYTDDDGDASTNYLVTACIGPCTLTADDVNDGDVPGYDGVPKGEDASKPKGFIPAPSPALVLGLVAVAAFLVRRRLA